MDALLQDARYAVRGWLQSPGFAAITVLCLALGIGINTTIFSVADTVLWRPLPFAEADRLVALYATQRANAVTQSGTSYQDFREWREQMRGVSAVAAHSYRSYSLTEGVESERFLGSAITWNLFPMLGVNPVLGRQFREDDDRPGASPVVLLSDGVWRRRYGADPNILGRTIVVDGTAHTVIGVMPPVFQFPQSAQLWTPLTPLEQTSSRLVRTVNPVARLGADATLDTANQEVAGIADQLARVHREDDGWSARAVSLRDNLMPVQVQVASVAMMGAVALVLLVACANVANLLLARATARQREIAVRAALGAGRARLLRQLLTESVVLGLLSVPLGVLVAYVGLDRLTKTYPPTVTLPYYVDWSMNGRVVLYAVFISVLTGIVFGLAPALQASAKNLFGALKDGGRGASGSRARTRTRHALVVVEVALSLVLLVGASMFVRSFLKLQDADGGVDTSQQMTMRMFMAGDAYDTPEEMTARVDDVIRRVEALPGVAAAFGSSLVPLSNGGARDGIVVEGTAIEPGKEPRVLYFGATPHGLRVLGVPLLAGRDFTEAEAMQRSGAVIVSKTFAKRFWPNQADVIGRRFRLLSEAPDHWFTVIGLAADFQPLLVRDLSTAEPIAIVPFPYQATRDTGITIRVAGIPPASITASARQAIGQSDSLLALFSVQTGVENRAIRIWSAGLLSRMFSIFGGVALFLASIGIYGVLAYSVAQRTQEIGVRTALGATRRHIFTGVLLQGAKLAAVGIVFGVAGALLVTPLIKTVIYNVPSADPISFGGTVAILGIVTIIAGWAPAARATTIQPIVALRAD